MCSSNIFRYTCTVFRDYTVTVIKQQCTVLLKKKNGLPSVRTKGQIG